MVPDDVGVEEGGAARVTRGRHLRAFAWGVVSLAAAAGLASAAAPGAAGKAARRMELSRIGPDSAQVLALLGGVRNPTCPLPGVATGGQPGAGHLTSLRKAGFRTVLDLRPADEPRGYDEPAAARRAGLAYRRLPIGHAGVPDSTFDAFRALMADARLQPVLVHCASGNRVGPVLIAWLVLDRGWDIQRATAAAKQGGLRSPTLEDAARDYIERHRGR